jgi:hypothetical protein
MVSYGYKRGITNIILVYPNISEDLNSSDRFEIISGFVGQEKLNVVTMEIPFWSFKDFNGIDEKLYNAVEQNLNNILSFCT